MLNCFETRTVPIIGTFAAGEKREQLAESLSRTVEKFNRSGDKTLVLPIEYLEVVAARA